MKLRRRSVTVLTILIAMSGCAQHRQVLSDVELQQARQDLFERVAHDQSETVSHIVDRLKREYDAHKGDSALPPAKFDMLVISGGGDFGAFGAGFLKGWGQVPAGPMARPEFDVVTGVSTGALIAPFAFLGTPADYDQIDSLYRHPKSDWMHPRGPFFFMPGYSSFATIPGLERDVRVAMDRSFIERIAAEAGKNRELFINTTNLDDGRPRAFNLAQEVPPILASGDLDRFYRLILASASIPGAFPPREIDSALYVDGGVTSNILYGGTMKSDKGVMDEWRRRYPNLSVPVTRYWVIFNNQLHAIPQTVQPTWPAVVGRTVELGTRAATITAMRHLFTIAELAEKNGEPFEVRLIAIPDEWRPPVPGVFKDRTMNDLADLGARLGADPASWQTTIP